MAGVPVVVVKQRDLLLALLILVGVLVGVVSLADIVVGMGVSVVVFASVGTH